MSTHDASLVVMANRLPVRRVRDGAAERWETSPGGLVSALGPVFARRPGAATWVGWSGITGTDLEPFEVDGLTLSPVSLTSGEAQLFYEGFCNATIWPLYHDSIIRSEYHRTWWDSYLTINRRFAAQAADCVAPDGVVWVHDYHLQLVPSMVRSMRSDVRIGFFLHIPFPPVELFLQLPWRRQILQGIAGADVVGFQTTGGAANFRALIERLELGTIDGDDVIVDGRRVEVRAFPIGVDVARIEAIAADPATRRRAAEIRESLGNPERVLLGVDRLDYTKGIARRLEAFAELHVEERFEMPKHLMIQVAEPTRENVPGYAEFRERVDALVGDINGSLGLVGRPAINYIHRSQAFEEVVALYLAADVMLVTPVRDGMNLVAKEFVASRLDDTGVLVLSEFTGAADSLTEALLVNPYDTDGLKWAFDRAAHLDPDEMTRRMKSLRESVRDHDVHRWADDWMTALGMRGTES
ncbi:MAG: trehalose-6-phosphate synthase [Actinobacteria bacterium]|nr:trehalose-6-phosphate synthase [Actinomycetota bacterium]